MTTRIDVEILVVLLLILVFVVWTIFMSVSRSIARRRYKPENDKARLGEEKRRSHKGSTNIDTGTRKEDFAIPGFDKSAGSTLLPTATTSNDGEEQSSIGEDSGSPRKLRRRRIFRRRK